MGFLDNIKNKAKSDPRRIVLPEGNEERTLKAADRIISEGIAHVILIGDPAEITALAGEYGLRNIARAAVVDPADNPKKEQYADLMVALRGDKGVTRESAMQQLADPLCLAAIMVKAGDADGEVAGARNTTGNVLRPALQYIRTVPGISVVSGAFFMLLPDADFGERGVMVFADCAVMPDPDAGQLAQIAVCSARTAKAIAGFDPRVAMLSFSTKGSATHPMADKVVEATRLARLAAPELEIDGELQADAAIVESVGRSKAPGSTVAGRANVLVFPSLESGNIAYKLVQRLAHAKAIGPVLQGMAAPVNDLSRGCSVDDIVNLAAITVCQAQDIKKP